MRHTLLSGSPLSRHSRPFAAVLIAAIALGASACGGGGGAAPAVSPPAVVNPPAAGAQSSSGAVYQGTVFHSSLQGAWRVLGEGSLLEIRGGLVEQFQETSSLCYRESRTTPTDLLKVMTYRDASSGGRVSLELHLTPDASPSYTLERVAQIPAHCRAAPATDAATTFQAMAEIFILDYGFFKERGIDWQSRIAQLAPKARLALDDNALQSVLVEALQGFNDPHVNLVRSNAGALSVILNGDDSATLRMLAQAYREQNKVANLDVFVSQWQTRLQETMRARLSGGSNGRVLDGAMVWGNLPGNIGYIEFSRLAGFAPNASVQQDLALVRSEMDRALRAMASTKAIIVDIAINDGGLDLVSAEIAGSFADARRLAFTVQQQRSQGRAPQSHFVNPKGDERYLKPVYLLTTDRTVSAGETLTLMLRQLPHVTHVGQTTSGAMSNVLAKSLPGNFIVTLSNEHYRDAAGVSYEGRGIPPKLVLPVFDPSNRASLYTSHAAAITALTDMLTSTTP